MVPRPVQPTKSQETTSFTLDFHVRAQTALWFTLLASDQNRQLVMMLLDEVGYGQKFGRTFIIQKGGPLGKRLTSTLYGLIHQGRRAFRTRSNKLSIGRVVHVERGRCLRRVTNDGQCVFAAVYKTSRCIRPFS